MDKRPSPGPARRSRPTPRPSSRPSPRPRRSLTPAAAPLPLAPAGHEPARASFVPDRRYTAVAAGSAVGAALALLITPDPAGRLIAGVAALLLAAYVIGDLWFSPRLVASSAGIVVNSPLARQRFDWAEVVEVRAETRVRHGLRNTTLEIDADPVLVVLSRRALGAEPLHAADLIEAFRPV